MFVWRDLLAHNLGTEVGIYVHGFYICKYEELIGRSNKGFIMKWLKIYMQDLQCSINQNKYYFSIIHPSEKTEK